MNSRCIHIPTRSLSRTHRISRSSPDRGTAAAEFGAVAVIGCESAALTAEDSVRNPAIKIVQTMRMEGVANFIPEAGFPPAVTLRRVRK